MPGLVAGRLGFLHPGLSFVALPAQFLQLLLVLRSRIRLGLLGPSLHLCNLSIPVVDAGLHLLDIRIPVHVWPPDLACELYGHAACRYSEGMPHMKLKLDITPDIARIMAAEIEAGERAVTAALGEAGSGLKTAWRGQITGASLGQRLANTIRSELYPKGKPSLSAAALVWSKAPQIVSAHDAGALIRSRSGFWLAIPTPAAGTSARGGRVTPGVWERRSGLRLRLVYRRTGPSLLVAEARLNTRGRAVASRSRTGRGVATVPIFLLLPQVKLPKRLDLDRDAERAQDAVPGLIVAKWVDDRIGS